MPVATLRLPSNHRSSSLIVPFSKAHQRAPRQAHGARNRTREKRHLRWPVNLTLPAITAAVLFAGNAHPNLRVPAELVAVAVVGILGNHTRAPRSRWRHDRGLQTYILPSEASPTLLDSLQIVTGRLQEQPLAALTVYMKDGDELRPALGLRTLPLTNVTLAKLTDWFDDTVLTQPQPISVKRLPWWAEAAPCAFQPLILGKDCVGFLCVSFTEAPRASTILAVNQTATQLAQVLFDLLRFRNSRTAASIDARTGCLTPKPFLEDLQRLVLAARAGHSSLSVLFFDLDGLSKVNNQLGHLVGDRFIAGAGESLRTAIRGGTDDRICRWGGDEFAAAVTDGDPATLGTRMAARMDAAVAEVPGAKEIGAGVSFGWATLGDDDDHVTEVMEREGLLREAGGDPDLAFAFGLVKLADDRMYAQKVQHHAARSQANGHGIGADTTAAKDGFGTVVPTVLGSNAI